jgi:quinol monooxygenase YgiN
MNKEIEMSEPIVFISHQRVKEGKLEGYKHYYRQVAEQAKANKPGTLAHIAFHNEEGVELSIIHIFPDAESMEAHMQGVDELAKKAYEYVEILSFEIYGKPTEAVLERMMQIVGSGIPLNIKPQLIGGYIRFNSGR